jgi:hypothetical protein
MCMRTVLKGLQAAGPTSGTNHAVQMQATGNNAKLGVEKTSLYAVQWRGKRRPPYFAGVDGRAGDLHAVFDESFDERPADGR